MSQEVVGRGTSQRTAGARAVLGLASFLGGAAVVGALVTGHHAAAPYQAAGVACPAAQCAAPKTISANDVLFAANVVQAQGLLKPDVSNIAARSMEYGVFQESDHVSGTTEQVKQVVVDSKGGDVIVFHSPGTRVLVLAGKVAIAPNNARAREFATKMSYTIKQDGERIRAVVSVPKDIPEDVYAAASRCIVIAPSEVRVVTRSGTL